VATCDCTVLAVPVGGSEMKVDDQDNEVPRGEPGEIVMRGPFAMSAYWNREEATEGVMGGGCFHTGDIAIFYEDGYFFILDVSG
jgi:long-chain acyl-CoA synthetase